jgi:Ras-related protein Rab-23
MIRRYCRGVFTEDYKKTIGVDFLEKVSYIESVGEDVRLMIWDTAGQEEFDTITRSYYRGAGAAVIVFSTTDRASFDAVRSWKQKLSEEVGDDVATCVVQNKGASHLSPVPVRPRRRGARRSSRTFPGTHLSAQGPSLSIPDPMTPFNFN